MLILFVSETVSNNFEATRMRRSGLPECILFDNPLQGKFSLHTSRKSKKHIRVNRFSIQELSL